MRHAIIVGGTKGLGRELARRFGSSDDWRVSVFGRSRPVEAEAHCTYHVLDVVDRAAGQRALEAAVSANGPLDLVCSKQGGGRIRDVGSPSPE